jgi:curved DNA-binding protein CbpA
VTDRRHCSDLYALLGVPADADTAELSRAYRRRLREVHPDTRGATPSGSRATDDPRISAPGSPDGESAATLQALQQAYLILRDPARRARYDAQRRRRGDWAPSRREPGDDAGVARAATNPSPSTTGGVAIPVRVHRRPPRHRPPWIRAGPVRVEPLPPDAGK